MAKTSPSRLRRLLRSKSYTVAFPTMNAAELVHIHTYAQTRVKSGNRPGRVCHSFWKPSFNINQTRLSSSSSVWFGASKCHLSCATLWICSCKYIQRYQFHLARLSFFFLSNLCFWAFFSWYFQMAKTDFGRRPLTCVCLSVVCAAKTQRALQAAERGLQHLWHLIRRSFWFHRSFIWRVQTATASLTRRDLCRVPGLFRL